MALLCVLAVVYRIFRSLYFNATSSRYHHHHDELICELLQVLINLIYVLDESADIPDILQCDIL